MFQVVHDSVDRVGGNVSMYAEWPRIQENYQLMLGLPALAAYLQSYKRFPFPGENPVHCEKLLFPSLYILC